jgi:hypothetical protein
VNLVNALSRVCARVCLLIAVATGTIGAQVRPDTAARPVVPDTTAGVSTAGPRPEIRAPLSPRRAFLYSLLLPGYSQSVLGRHRAGALQLAFEAASIIMIRQSAADVREARRMRADSITISFVDDAGRPLLRRVPTPFTESLVRSRRSHLEDWIAVLLANHLFSAADGYVASLLWDLPAEVSVSATDGSTNLGFRVRW